MNERKPQNRCDVTGQYDLTGGMDRVCVCTHILGDHAAGTPHECFVPTWPPYTPCDCKKFMESRRKK